MKKQILAITYWSFKDALVQTYTLPYIKQIQQNLGQDSIVWLFTLEQKHLRMNRAEWRQAQSEYKQYGIKLLRSRYRAFSLAAMLSVFLVLSRLLLLTLVKNFKSIYCWGAPAGVIGFYISKLTGKRLIIDSFEPHAEAMVENGTWNANGFAFRFLFRMEKKMAKRAFALIGTTEGMRQYAIDKFGFNPKRFYAKPAIVDTQIFNPERFDRDQLRSERGWKDKVVCVYAGKIGGIYLEQEIFDFFAVCSKHWGDKFVALLLTNAEEKRVHELANIAGCPIACIQISFVPHSQIPEIMSMADFALNPVKPVPSKRFCTSIKDGEYWAMGLPVVITKDISDDSDIIEQNSIGYVLQSLTSTEYLNAVLFIDHAIKGDGAIQRKTIEIAKKYRTAVIAQNVYKAICDEEHKSLVKVQKKNVLVLTYWSFNDALIQTYTLPYVHMIRNEVPLGSCIYLFTIEQKNYLISKKAWRETKSLYREKHNIRLIRMPYRRFGLRACFVMFIAILRLSCLVLVKRINYVHTWCTPAGMLGFVISKLMRRKLILDSFEPHAELMLESETWSRKSRAFNLLFSYERKMAAHAAVAIATNESMRQYCVEKYNVFLKTMFIKPACVDFSKFNIHISANEILREELGLKDKIVMVYAGKLGGIYLDREVFDFIRVATNYWGDRFRFLFLTSTPEGTIQKYAQDTGISNHFVVSRFLPHAEVPSYMALASFGINPMKPIPARKHSAPIKDSEYWAMGLPVVITKDISDDSEIIEKNGIGYVLSQICESEYLKAVEKIDQLLSENQAVLREKIFAVAQSEREMARAERVYKQIYGNHGN